MSIKRKPLVWGKMVGFPINEVFSLSHLFLYIKSKILTENTLTFRPRLARVNAEDVLMGMSVEGSCGSRLQIVIVCPIFLDAIASSPGAPILASMLQPASVLAMLLGVGQQTLESHHLSSESTPLKESNFAHVLQELEKYYNNVI